jgi:fructose-1,6-bisphosphatase/sedoheptulose 1,7-bisphosphatase-like protein
MAVGMLIEIGLQFLAPVAVLDVFPKGQLQGSLVSGDNSEIAAEALEQVGDGVPVAAHRGNVVAERTTGNAVQMPALVVIGEGQVRDAA